MLLKKHEVFAEQIEEFSRHDVKQFVREAIDMFPDYFFEIPGSLTEKHHPLWDLGYGGLVRHTIGVFTYVKQLAHTFELDPYELEICKVGALLHDSMKYGISFSLDTYGPYYNAHGLLVGPYFKDLRVRLTFDKVFFDKVMHSVERHMGTYKSGKWTEANVLIDNRLDAVLHLADYVVSREDFILEKFKDFHCEAEKQPPVSWAEEKDLWWRKKLQDNKYYTKEIK